MLAVLTVLSALQESVQIQVFQGPSACVDKERVKKTSITTIDYTASIDVNTAEGEPGDIIDSTREEVPGGRGEPFTFMVGLGHVLKGWDEGLIGLCKGARALLTLQPEVAYGAEGAVAPEGVPAGATLRFGVARHDLKLFATARICDRP